MSVTALQIDLLIFLKYGSATDMYFIAINDYFSTDLCSCKGINISYHVNVSNSTSVISVFNVTNSWPLILGCFKTILVTIGNKCILIKMFQLNSL